MVNPDLSGSEVDEIESVELYTKGCTRACKDRTVSDFRLLIFHLCRDRLSRDVSCKHASSVLLLQFVWADT